MKRSELAFIAIKPPLDYLALITAGLIAYGIRYFPTVQEIRPVLFDLKFSSYLSIVSATALVWIAIFAISGLYSASGTKTLRDELAKVFVACSAGLALVLAIMVFSRYLFDSRFIILASWALAIVFVNFGRIIIKLAQRRAYKSGFGVHRVVLVGSGHIADTLREEFEKNVALGSRVVLEVPTFDAETQEKLAAMSQSDVIDEIIQINPGQDHEKTEALVNFVNEYHLDYRYTADLLGTQLINLEVATYAGTPIVEVKKTRLDGWGKIYKRVFDIIASALLIILFLPLMVISALIIKLTSPGPIFFTYQRSGQYGKPFTYFKFRSMVKDAHQVRYQPDFQAQYQNIRQGSPMIKFANDPRITPFGRFIRRWSIDELPELFLVFVGTMSLVGPRPHEIEEVQQYQRHHKRVLTIKSGITGLAQVSGRSDLDFEEEVKLDTYYLENWSPGLDITILLKTPLAIIKRRQTV